MFQFPFPARAVIALPDQYSALIRKITALASMARDGAPKLSGHFDSVDAYCMFVGYPYSGHILFGALLDAHRDMVISHELNALFWIDWVRRREELFYLILQHAHSFSDQGAEWNNYQYSVDGQHQGRFDSLRVIGDKKGGMSTQMLGRDPGLLDRLRAFVNLPVKLVHVVRNPYDNIATMSRRDGLSLFVAAQRYFWLARVNEGIERRTDVETKRIYYEEFLNTPQQGLVETVAFLGQKADEGYLAACAKIVFEKPTLPRHKVVWEAETMRFVASEMAKISFLKNYSFES